MKHGARLYLKQMGKLALILAWWTVIPTTKDSHAKEVPHPSFTMPDPKTKGDKSPLRRSTRENYRSHHSSDGEWLTPSFALGLGTGLPQILPVEGYLFFGRFIGLKASYIPAFPTSIRVEIPSDVISAKQGLAVANPDFTADFKGSYGGGFGFDLMIHPFRGSFFLSGGIFQQKLGIKGDAKAPILVCSIIEAAKEPPCGDPEKRLETKTQVVVRAGAETTSYVNNIQAGWFARIGRSGYFTFRFGYGRPWNIKRKANVNATLDSPSATPDEITGALAEIRAEKEEEMNTKVLKEVMRLDEKGLPMIAIGAGIVI